MDLFSVFSRREGGSQRLLKARKVIKRLNFTRFPVTVRHRGLDSALCPSTKVPEPAKGIHISLIHCAECCGAEGMSPFGHCCLKPHGCSGIIVACSSGHGNSSDLKFSNLNSWEKFASCYQNGGIIDSATDNVGTKIALTMTISMDTDRGRVLGTGNTMSCFGVPAVLSFCHQELSSVNNIQQYFPSFLLPHSRASLSPQMCSFQSACDWDLLKQKLISSNHMQSWELVQILWHIKT